MIVYVSREELIEYLRDLIKEAKFKLMVNFAIVVLLKPETKEEKKDIKSLVSSIKDKMCMKYDRFFVLHY